MRHFRRAIVFGCAVSTTLYLVAPLLPYPRSLLEQDRQAAAARAATTGVDEAGRPAPGVVTESTSPGAGPPGEGPPAAVRELGPIEGYVVKLSRRDGTSLEVLGNGIIYATLALVIASLAYLIGLWRGVAFPGWGAPGRCTSDFEGARRAQLERKWGQTASVEAVRGTNADLSAMDETRTLYLLAPLTWAEWVMPILGFTGTVLGISAAIGSLQLGLRAVFRDNGVSSEALDLFNRGFAGLGVAFDTTLFGLLGLGIVGTATWFARRQALGSIRKIDLTMQEWIDSIEVPEPAWKGAADFLEALAEWWKERGGEWVDRALEGTPGFREWIQNDFPRFLQELTDEHARELDEALKTVGEGVSRGITRYGEALVRLGIVEMTDLRLLRRIVAFHFLCSVEGAQGAAGDPFWSRFAAAARRPLAEAPQMTLMEPATEGRRVTALAVASAAPRVAVAFHDEHAGAFIHVYLLGLGEGDTLNLHPVGAQEIDATVDALCFDTTGGRVAYLLTDGTLGIHDLRDGSSRQIVLNGTPTRPAALAWWRHGREGLLLSIERDVGESEFVVAPVLTTAWPAGATEAESPDLTASLRLDGFDVQVIVPDDSGGRILLSGSSTEGAMIKVIALRGGQPTFVEEIRLASDGAAAALAPVPGSGGRDWLCGISDGSVWLMNGLGTARATQCLPCTPGRPLAIAIDPPRGAVTIVREGLSALDVHGLNGGESVSTRIPAHGPLERAGVGAGGRLVVAAGSDAHVAYWELPQYVTH